MFFPSNLCICILHEAINNKVAPLCPNPVHFLSTGADSLHLFPAIMAAMAEFKSNCPEKKSPLNPSFPLRRKKKSTHQLPSVSFQNLTDWLSFSQWMPPNKCAVQGLHVLSHSWTNVIISRLRMVAFNLCSQGRPHLSERYCFLYQHFCTLQIMVLDVRQGFASSSAARLCTVTQDVMFPKSLGSHSHINLVKSQ